jgi:hypothetical protein
MKKLFVLFAGLLVLFVVSAQDVNLSLKLEKGKIYKQHFEVKQNRIQEVMGQKVDVSSIVGSTVSFLVTSVDDGNYDLEVKYEKMTLSMLSAQGAVEFSSENKSGSDIISALMGGMVNKPFRVVISNGRITEVSGIDALFTAASSQFSTITTTQLDQLKPRIMRSFGEDVLKNNVSLLLSALPNKVVAKGEKWVGRSRILVGTNMISRPDFELVDLTTAFASIKGVGKYATQNKDEKAAGSPMKYDLTGTILSEAKVDRSTGWVLEAKIEQDFMGKSILDKSEQNPEGLTIPLTIKSSMIVSN